MASAAPAAVTPVTVTRVDSWVRVTPDSTGRVTIPYCPTTDPCQFPSAPANVVVTGRYPYSGPAIPANLVAYNRTTTGFTLRALNQSGTVITTAIEVYFHASMAGFDPDEEVRTVTVTTGSTGYATVNYANPRAGVVPRTVVVSGVNPSSGPNIPVSLMVSARTASGFTVRALNQSGTVIPSTSITLSYYVSWAGYLNRGAGWAAANATSTVPTDSSGYATVTFAQALPAAPSGIAVSGAAPASGPSIAASLMPLSPSATGFRVRVLNQTGGVVANQSVTLSYHAVAGVRSVATAPPAPTGVTAQPSDGKATVSWTRPATDGGAAITGYRITASPGGASVDVVDVTSATFPGLTNGTAYTFTVAAINLVGVGAASAPSAAVTPHPATAPAAPSSVAATARHASAVVTWQRPASDGGAAITGYTVTAQPGGAQVNVTAPSTTATVPNLTNGTAYTFTVTATNARGTSPASAASPPVTPAFTPPDPPSDVTASALGDGAVTLQWTAPGYTGGQAVTGYTVTVQPGGRTIPVAADVTSADVTGLTSQTAYTFTVTAQNPAGISAASAPTAPLTPDLALTPQARVLSSAALATLTQVTRPTVTSATLTFTNAPAEVTGLQPGNVLVVGETPAAPDGLVRTVATVTTSGDTTTVTTTPAALTDAFTDAAFDLTATPTPASGAAAASGAATSRGQMAATPADRPAVQSAAPRGAPGPGTRAGSVTPAGVSTATDPAGLEFPVDTEPWPGVKVTGSLTVYAPTVEVHYDLLNFQQKSEFTIAAGIRYKADLTVQASADADLPEKSVTLADFGIPKALQLRELVKASLAVRVSVYMGGHVSAGLKVSGSIEGNQTLHVDVVNQRAWTDPSTPVGEITPPTAFGDASVEVGARAGLVLQIAGEDALRLNGSLADTYTVDLHGDPWWRAEGCLKVGVEVLPFPGGHFAYKNDEFGKYCITLDKATGSHLDLTMTPTDAAVAPGGTAQFGWSSYPYALPAIPTWSVVGGDANGTITATGLYTAPATPGIYSIRVTLNPNMSGTATVRVGAPGAPTLTVQGVGHDDAGHPAVTILIGQRGAAPDKFIITPDPFNSSNWCGGTGWTVPYASYWILVDDVYYVDRGSVYPPYPWPLASCGLLQPGFTYTFLVQGFNQGGGGPITRSSPVTIPIG
jgi:hypothetical protein